MLIRRTLLGVLMGVVVSLLAACSFDSDEAAEPALVSIRITPATLSTAVGLTQQYTAIGTYTSGPDQDITASVSWALSDSATASIGADGLATMLSEGSCTLTASASGVTSNSATLNVIPAALVSIQITPGTISKEPGLTQQYAATGTYTDAGTHVITTLVAWNSSDPAAATVDASGLASTLAVGSATITASLDGITSNASTLRVRVASMSATGSMNTPRSGHTATLLNNGKVLVTGGFGSSGGYLASSELYDPSTGEWTFTGSLSTARHEHTATLLNDGTVLVTGGFGSADHIESSEIYDPTTGQWMVTGSLTTARSDHTATLLADGKVLVVGGSAHVQYPIDPSSATSEIYDPTTRQWTVTGSLHNARRDHAATRLKDGKILVTGGHQGILANLISLASSELYDPGTGQWTAIGSLAMARTGHTASLLDDGKILVTGGTRYDCCLGLLVLDSSELYDPTTAQWTAAPSLAAARSGHTATVLNGGTVLVLGGLVATSELYDAPTGRWLPTASLTNARSHHTATLLNDGKVLVVGGSRSSVIFSNSELYD